METQRYGRYTLIEQIGQGGMSVVYQARDPVLDRFVALKLLHPHLAERADSRARFAREAKAVARLKHPNIMEVFDYAPAESTRSYIVTEYINGPTLREFLGEKPLKSPEAAIIILQPIADALAKAHDAGIVHRDVKPENIMIREDGSTVLMDFGIAQMIDMPTLTATGTILGSPAHMAPEVIDGSTVDTPADVFSFGTMLYWCISGVLPFTGPNPSALFRRILETDFDHLGQHSEAAGQALSDLVAECMHKDPKQRPTARQVSARMKLHLETLGLTETSNWRKELTESRESAEPALIAQTVKHLLDHAEEKMDQSSIPELLDSVNRALAHRPNDKRAIKILNRLTNRQRLHRIGLGMLIAVFLTGGSQLALNHFSAKPKISTRPPTPVTANTDSGQNFAADAAFQSVLTDSLDASIALPNASRVDGQPLPTDAFIEAVKELDASQPKPSKKDSSSKTVTNTSSRLKPSRPPRQFKGVRTNKTPSTGAVTNADGPLTTIQVSSELQGARIIVNGTLHPQKYLSRVRAKGGLQLPPGKHRIEIENLGCKTEAYDRVVVAGQRVPAIFHECKWLDAYLRVNTTEGALEIRDRDDKNQRILGETNQRITMDMNAYRSQKQIMIRRADNSFMMLTINLTAGQTTVVDPPVETSKANR